MSQSDRQFTAWIDGPYGNPPKWESYDHVIFVASGIGMAAHMLAIKHLVEGREDRSIANKTISLYWHIDNTLNVEWVKTHFDYLLQLDYERTALNIEIFVPAGTGKDFSSKRIKVLDNTERITTRVEAELDCLRGKVLLSASTSAYMRRQLRHLCTKKYFFSPLVKYHQSDFQLPEQSWSLFSGFNSFRRYK